MARTTALNKRKIAAIILGVDLILLAGFAIHMTSGSSDNSASLNNANLTLPSSKRISTPVVTKPAIKWMSDSIGKNGSLTELFFNLNLSQADLRDILKLKLAKQYLSVVHEGEQIDFQVDANNQLHAMKVPLAHGDTLYIEKSGQQFSASITKAELTKTIEYASATIHSSLSNSAHNAGLSTALIANLTQIFADKINFAKDIRKGAHFEFLYPAFYKGDDKVKSGPILAAKFTNDGHTYEAIRFTYPLDHTGYYTPEGRNVKRLFLKAPLHYSRISSFFSYHRMDPILHRFHPHLGIDYAAPIGTPVHAMSDGRIVFMGKKGGYGNAMIIAYGRHYRTLYGHLHGFAHGMHRGEHVSEGETVAYVGDTGWSTGPHLHYSLYINGIPKNPLKTHLPMGSSVPLSYLSQFEQIAKSRLAQLDLESGPSLANS